MYQLQFLINNISSIYSNLNIIRHKYFKLNNTNLINTMIIQYKSLVSRTNIILWEKVLPNKNFLSCKSYTTMKSQITYFLCEYTFMISFFVNRLIKCCLWPFHIFLNSKNSSNKLQLFIFYLKMFTMAP